jgi:hypothetical protein
VGCHQIFVFFIFYRHFANDDLIKIKLYQQINMIETIEISFKASDVDNSERVIYVIKVLDNYDNVLNYYIGKTGNNAGIGISEPFERLINHFYSKGKTFGIAKDKNRRIDKKFIFYYTKLDKPHEKNEIYKKAENWLIYEFFDKLENKNLIANQDCPKKRDKLSESIEFILMELFNKATKM